MHLVLMLLQEYGLWLVFANVLLLQLGLPVPAYPTLVVVGALTARGGVTVTQVIAVATIASVLADLVWYLAGARHGRRVLRLMCRLSISPDSCVRQTERLYERWGAPSLLVAKFIPGFAVMATSLAGLLRTPLWRFALFDGLGAVVWAAIAVVLGRLFSDAIDDVLAAFRAAGHWGLLALLAALGAYLAVRAIQRYRLLRALRMARVSVEELQRMIGAGERPLIVDVRSPASQAEGRIPGAIWIDNHAFDESLRAQGLDVTRGDGEVIVYCACPNEVSAAAVAKKLMRAGFRRVRPLGGGIEAWVERGYALERAAANAGGDGGRGDAPPQRPALDPLDGAAAS